MRRREFISLVARRNSATDVTRDLLTYLLDLLGIGVVYFVLAKIGLTLASINSSTSAIWPATGFALAAALIWGYRVGPAVLIASFAANVTNVGSIYAATAIALGNTLEALVAAWLINRWCDGRETFATTTGVAKFALVCVASTTISATVGVGSLIFSGDAPTPLAMTWMTWWLGDLAGALVVAPFVVLWAAGNLHSFERAQWGEFGTIVAATIAVGVIAFSPLIEQSGYRDPLGFLALPPLLWAALRRDPRETATVVIILCVFAVWGTLAGSGPFARVSLNDSFLLLVMFFISISVPSMALSADVLMRRRSEEQLRHAHDELAASAGELRDTAERLQVSRGELEQRVEQRTQELKEALQQQTALAEVFKEISRSSFDLQKLLNQLVDLAARLCAANSASIWRPFGETYQIAAAFGHSPEHTERLDRLSVRPGRDTGVGRALLELKVVHIVDMQGDLELHQGLKAGRNRTMIAVPLMRGGVPIGVLVMLRQTLWPFTEREIELATTIADQAMIAIENVRLFEALQARTRELGEANQAKSRFIAAASHDLRQPLHALGLFVDRLHGRVKVAERRGIVEQIDAAVAAVDELFNQLLDISKLDAGVLTPIISDFPIAHLLKRTESTFAATARKKGLSLRIVSNSAWVRSDAILLERILLNLVSNAVGYTATGGIVVGCRRRGGQLRIEVWDSGPGIPKDQHQNIFAEFHQVGGSQHERRSGLGLGLAIVDRLCRLLDHRIQLTSTLGNGSRFSVIVPLVATQALAAEPKASVRAALGSIRGKLVVVIDDDALVLDSMGGLLRSWGCDVVTATSAHVALAGLADRMPDLIISDYRLSDGQNGIEAIEKLREAFSLSVPAFLISGDTAPERLRDARASGYHLLHKPVRPRALRAMLGTFLKKRDLVDANP
jgi:signal transduction histidine kinase/integral membrane sensor domain MASE1/CheY-like chemotaxis protein